jgi:hypothetical protein
MTIKILFAIWFSLSILLTIGGNLALKSFLNRADVKTIFGLQGTPGYLDMVYIKWCKENNKPYLLVITLRWALILSSILAMSFFKKVMGSS